MVDLTGEFKIESDPAAKTVTPQATPAAAAPAAPGPVVEVKADATPCLNQSFIKASDSTITVNPEPGKQSVFSRQVVTPMVKLLPPGK